MLIVYEQVDVKQIVILWIVCEHWVVIFGIGTMKWYSQLQWVILN